ncbi:hypothetical protein INT45_012276 [Circinella minor]|uniref:NAD(P)-binding domain-containing protein n=1 Tax=Circinella minor TaxID=1195481 RepID=A0A8H7S522_9FUNG|nr:hypothetical protein INT45_012276 [Circinella minor]
MSQKQLVCVITNVDSLVGYAVACRLLEGREELQNAQVRCLCRRREKLEDIERLGGEIMEVDYQDQNKLRHAMKQARCVFLIPEHSSQRVQEAQNVIKAAKQENVEHMAMKSWIGIDHIKEQNNQQFKCMSEYRKIEEMVRQEFGDQKHCISRLPLLNQLFYLMTPLAEKQQALCMPIKQESKWGSIDLRDMIDAIFNIFREQYGKQVFVSQKQVYCFTPQKNWKGEQVARSMALALEKSPEQFKYKHISNQEWKQYMHERHDDQRFKDRPDAEQGTEKPYTMPISRYFNDDLIQELLEWFQLASEGHADISTKDLQEILQHKPRDIEEYFKNNRDQFHRFR